MNPQQYVNTFCDLLERTPISISFPHHKAHQGEAFYITRRVTLPVGADDEIRIAVPSPDVQVHFTFSILSDAAVTVDLYEGTELTYVSGNDLIPLNRNRNSTNESIVVACHTPAGAGDGTIIWSGAAGAGGFLTSAPGQLATRAEIILRQNTVYLLRISGAQDDIVSILLDWYEATYMGNL